MTTEDEGKHQDPRIQAALQELEHLVQSRYPAASFSAEPAADDPNAIHLVAMVDVDDPDEVVDLTIERELELQIEQGIPVHVIPLRTAARLQELRRGEPSAYTPNHAGGPRRP